MWLLIVEACAAFFLLVFIVWWVMFHGRPEERKRTPRQENRQLDEPPRAP